MEKLIERITNLLSIKSLVTLITTIVFAFLSVTGKVDSTAFMQVFSVVIAFYFGTQMEK